MVKLFRKGQGKNIWKPDKNRLFKCIGDEYTFLGIKTGL